MIVKKLIQLLKTMPQDMEVGYENVHGDGMTIDYVESAHVGDVVEEDWQIGSDGELCSVEVPIGKVVLLNIPPFDQ